MTDLTKNIPSTAIESHTVQNEDWCYTRSTVFQCDYTWTIQNFNLFVFEEESTAIKSSTFSAGEGTCKWFLRLHTPAAKHEHVKLYLVTSYNATELSNYGPITGKLQCSLIGSQGFKQNIFGKNFIINSDKVSSGFDYFLHRNTCIGRNYLSGSDLKINCTVTYIEQKYQYNVSSQCNLINSYLPSPMEDFGTLFNNQELSDVTVCVGNEKYPAHQLILATRSSVFKAMFTHDMKEKRLNRIEIKDIDEKTFQEVLRYIYTGKVKGIETVAFELLFAADKYDLAGLKMMCENQLCKMLATDTAVKILSFSNTYNLPNLKNRAIQYVKMNLAEIADSESWNDLLSQSDLMKAVIKA